MTRVARGQRPKCRRAQPASEPAITSAMPVSMASAVQTAVTGSLPSGPVGPS